MKIKLTEKAKRDLEYFKYSGNQKILNRIRQLISSIMDNPFSGIGKPEALKYEYKGIWSRRITQEHRLIYQVK